MRVKPASQILPASSQRSFGCLLWPANRVNTLDIGHYTAQESVCPLTYILALGIYTAVMVLWTQHRSLPFCDLLSLLWVSTILSFHNISHNTLPCLLSSFFSLSFYLEVPPLSSAVAQKIVPWVHWVLCTGSHFLFSLAHLLGGSQKQQSLPLGRSEADSSPSACLGSIKDPCPIPMILFYRMEGRHAPKRSQEEPG